MTKYQKKNILIGGLLAVVVLMGIAYAAFASNLTITGTGTTSGNWCIGFDSTRTNDLIATSGITGGTTPTGSMSFSGDACSTSFKTTASLNASFKQPGDKIEYTLTIANKGSFNTAIESINVDNQSVTSDTTITKGNIKYIIEMPQSTSLAVNATTTMKVTAMFQNDTPVGSSTTEQQTISIAINAAQDDGSGGMVVSNPYTGSIYSFSDEKIVSIGDSIATFTLQKWCPKNNNYNGCEDYWYYDSKAECDADIQGDEYTCQQGTITEGGIGDYTTTASELNKAYYIKHDVVNDIITASYACFVYNNIEHCLRGGVDECQWDDNANGGNGGCTVTSTPIFDANTQIIKDFQSYYNISNNACSFNTNGFYASSSCRYGDVTAVAERDGYVEVSNHDDYYQCLYHPQWGGSTCIRID